MGLAALLAMLASLVPEPDRRLARAARILAGFSAAALLAAAVALSSTSLESLRDRSHLWPIALVPPAGLGTLFRLASGTSTPGWISDLVSSAWSLAVQLLLAAVAGLLAARERRLSRWIPVLALAGLLAAGWLVGGFRFDPRTPVSLFALLAAAVAVLALAVPGIERRGPLVGIGVFAALANLRAAFSPSMSGHFDGPAHLASSLTWIVFLCVLAPRLLVPSPAAERHTRRFIAVLLLLGGWGAAFAGMAALRVPWKEAVETREGRVFVEPRYAGFYRAIGREIRPGERVLVLPEINGVDAVFTVENVSPLLDHLPGWLDPALEGRLVAQFAKSPPDAVVLFDRRLTEYGVERFGRGYGESLYRWIERADRPVYEGRAGAIFRPRGPGPPPP
jgi:hypothetical protein